MDPWLYIVMLGFAITGFAWMMPRNAGKPEEKAFAGEDAYRQLLEDLEAENRELFDAVAKFKQENDATVEKLGRRVVEMERQMKEWTDGPIAASPAEAPLPPLSPPSPNAALNAASQLPISLRPTPNGHDIDPAAREVAVGFAPEDPAIEPGAPPTTIRGRYPELLDMHDNGRSIEHIAKATGKNKGEVQLILQLARREERHA